MGPGWGCGREVGCVELEMDGLAVDFARRGRRSIGVGGSVGLEERRRTMKRYGQEKQLKSRS